MSDPDTRTTPQADAVDLVPEAIARTLRFVPLSTSARTLTIAVVVPLSGEQVHSLTQLTRRQLVRQVEPGADVVDSLLETAYGETPQVDSASAA